MYGCMFLFLGGFCKLILLRVVGWMIIFGLVILLMDMILVGRGGGIFGLVVFRVEFMLF